MDRFVAKPPRDDAQRFHTYLFTMQRGGWVYILANKPYGTMYTGVTSNLINRIAQHRSGNATRSFTARYGIYLLVYYEGFQHIAQAIAREKQLKGGPRKQKVELVLENNPKWLDLYDDLVQSLSAPTDPKH